MFTKPPGRVDMRDIGNWWADVGGADWRHPRGPDSTIKGLERHPVVQVALEDAEAYAAWAGIELPTEAEWEFAARGGLDGAEYVWGAQFMPRGKPMANTWHGEFPWQNLRAGDFEGTAPVTSFPPNGYGLYEMAGNVWEWTADWYRERHAAAHKACCVPANPRGGAPDQSYDPQLPDIRIPRKVIKGGSHLCAPNYCRCYRPAARYPHPVRVVFRSGELSAAMRASMSVPALLAPVAYQGRYLVDGGLVDNLPVAAVRARCNADVVIAVDVGSPLFKPKDVNSIASVTGQMINILTEQNAIASRALIQPGDIYIKPDLQGISAADFNKFRAGAERAWHARTADPAHHADRKKLGPALPAFWRRPGSIGAGERVCLARRLPPQVD